MAKIKPDNQTHRKPGRPALTPEGREMQLISAAYDLAEQRILDGTASSQELTHFLKLGSTKNQLEMERLREENKLLRAKTKAIEDGVDMKSLYVDAIAAMKRYTGQGDSDEC